MPDYFVMHPAVEKVSGKADPTEACASWTGLYCLRKGPNGPDCRCRREGAGPFSDKPAVQQGGWANSDMAD